MEANNLKRLSSAGFLVAIGIVFGDIGTSPLYTYTAIIGNQTITELIALGGVSAIFWTLFFQTTVKYVFITLRADNKGEGGIFSLYTLIRKYRRWLLFPAIAGGSFLLADSIITPPISVSSAIEG
ncbi:MAG: KUP/HAK/KT family potassium transporter, partial [Bacteroidia bacterium]